MPIVKLPSGEYVNVADDVTPERLQQIVAENSRSSRQRPAAGQGPTFSAGAEQRALRLRQQGFGTPQVNPNARLPQQSRASVEQQAVRREVAERAGTWRNSTPAGYVRDALKGYTFGFDDEIQGAMRAATGGVLDAVRSGDLSMIGSNYRVGRDVAREEEHNRHADGGLGHTAAEIAGALFSPVGLVGKAVKAGGAALGIGRAAAALPGAARVASVASRVARPVPVQAALAGAGMGALNAVGNNETGDLGDMFNDATRGATIGGVTGGVLGTAANGAQRVVQIARDRNAAAASRTAYGRIADLLANGQRPASSTPGVARLPMTPEYAARELAVANGRGTDARLMDVLPGLQAQAGKLARKPDVAGSNRLIEASEARMAGRGQELEDQVAGRITPRTGTDALRFQQSNTAARKAAGQRDYDAALNRPIAFTPEMEQFVTKDNPLVRRAMQNAYTTLRSQDIDPATIGLRFNAEGLLERIERPTMRAFDYMKRGLDKVSRDARQAGDLDAARIAGDQTNALRDMVARANPEYRTALDTQRAFFQQDSAAELGKSVVGRLQGAKADPRQLLQEIQQIHPNDRDALRTGFADALIALRDTKTAGKGPVAVLQSLMRTPNQRRVLENLFEGRGNLGRFDRWLRREVRATKTDAMVAGPQSITSLMQGTEGVLPEGLGRVAFDAVRGGAYGGVPGAVTAGFRSVQDLSRGIGPAANEEIARLLMGRGEDLAQGVNAARAFKAARTTANRRRVVRAARGAQQPFTDELGEN